MTKKQRKSKSKPTQYKFCPRCETNKILTRFYASRVKTEDGLVRYCKDCVNEIFGRGSTKNMKKVCQVLDFPFLKDLWVTSSLNESALGAYLRSLRIKRYNEYKCYADSVGLEIDDKEIDDEIRERKKGTEIKKMGKPSTGQGKKTKKKKEVFEVTDEIREIWGAGYTDEEYEAFERKFNYLSENYPARTVLHTEALRNYVRYKVKAEISAAREGETKDVKIWEELAQKAATAAKINPSQLSKSDLQDGLNSFGELVKTVEQVEDIIPVLPKFKEEPQDKVDFAIWCYVNYVRHLQGLKPVNYKDLYFFIEERKKEYADQLGFVIDEDGSDIDKYVMEIVKEKEQEEINLKADDEVKDDEDIKGDE